MAEQSKLRAYESIQSVRAKEQARNDSSWSQFFTYTKPPAMHDLEPQVPPNNRSQLG